MKSLVSNYAFHILFLLIYAIDENVTKIQILKNGVRNLNEQKILTFFKTFYQGDYKAMKSQR